MDKVALAVELGSIGYFYSLILLQATFASRIHRQQAGAQAQPFRSSSLHLSASHTGEELRLDHILLYCIERTPNKNCNLPYWTGEVEKRNLGLTPHIRCGQLKRVHRAQKRSAPDLS